MTIEFDSVTKQCPKTMKTIVFKEFLHKQTSLIISVMVYVSNGGDKHKLVSRKN